MRVHWTESALADLRVVETTIARHSPRYAQAMVERIFSRSEGLQTLPRLGPIVPEYEEESIRELFESPFRIIYRIIDEEQVDIIAVVHAARRLPLVD